MHSGKYFTFKEVILWTRKDLYQLTIIGSVPTILYVVFDWKWLSIPWLPIALLGTAVAFVVGFKNNASYDRMWEARRAWGSIVNISRGFGFMVKDFIGTEQINTYEESKINSIRLILIKRHLAWLTALRFQLREARIWEGIYKPHNQEYKAKWFRVHEHDHKPDEELMSFLSLEDYQKISAKTNKAAQILALQSEHIKALKQQGLIDDFRHMEIEKTILELANQQGVCERIKNFPYPRQYATLNLYFIKIFVVLVPLGMLHEFERMNSLIWLAIPFSVLSGWIFTTLEKIGESTESPFEGSANDVPITTISRSIEIDLLEMFNQENIPKPLKPQHNILT